MADTAKVPRHRPTDGQPVARRAHAPVASPASSLAQPRVAAPGVSAARPSRPLAPVTPLPSNLVAMPPVAAVPAVPVPGRAALRAERQAARRERRLYICLGLGAIAAMLGATVVVLDVFH